MNIIVNGVAEELIREKLASSSYTTAEDLLVASLRALARQEREEAAVAEFQEKVRLGVEQLDRGESSDGDEFFAQLEREEAEWLEAEKIRKV